MMTIDLGLDVTFPSTWQGLSDCHTAIGEAQSKLTTLLQMEIGSFINDSSTSHFTSIGKCVDTLVSLATSMQTIIDSYGEATQTNGSKETLNEDCKAAMEALIGWLNQLLSVSVLAMETVVSSIGSQHTISKVWFEG